ncbi:MAG: C39 family peptidase [Candidatus Dormibacteraceae bacterium]
MGRDVSPMGELQYVTLGCWWDLWEQAMNAVKPLAGIGTAVVVGMGVWLYCFEHGGATAPIYSSSTVVPMDATTSGGAPPASLPSALVLPVPYTDQAPLGNWAARQHTCEEATLVMVDGYLRGDRSGGSIDPVTADRAIERITPWKPSVDLTPEQLGMVAQTHLGWSYRVMSADPRAMQQQLTLGRPLIVGVRTHGLGNPEYPGYLTHYEQPEWSVSHYVVVIGYDSSGGFVLNDPGINRGEGYRISYDQLMHAVDDLDQFYPNLSMGRVFLVLAPPAPA